MVFTWQLWVSCLDILCYLSLDPRNCRRLLARSNFGWSSVGLMGRRSISPEIPDINEYQTITIVYKMTKIQNQDFFVLHDFSVSWLFLPKEHLLSIVQSFIRPNRRQTTGADSRFLKGMGAYIQWVLSAFYIVYIFWKYFGSQEV